MLLNNLNKVLGVTAASICTIFASGQSAQAFTLLNSDWHVVQDSFIDGTNGYSVGSLSRYEMFGMATKVDTDTNELFIAIHSNLPQSEEGVTYGDLLFNFTDKSLKDASAAGELFGVRFADNNAGVSGFGLYENVQAKSVTKWNSGWGGFADYQRGIERQINNTPDSPQSSDTSELNRRSLDLSSITEEQLSEVQGLQNNLSNARDEARPASQAVPRWLRRKFKEAVQTRRSNHSEGKKKAMNEVLKRWKRNNLHATHLSSVEDMVRFVPIRSF